MAGTKKSGIPKTNSVSKYPGKTKMASEERRYIHGVPVVFPCKPYPSQFSMMEKVIKGIERSQNCLLESPTGSGKSLALLCSALAWQTAEYAKKGKEDLANETEKVCSCTCKQNEDKNTSTASAQEINPMSAKVSTSNGSPTIDISDDDDDFQDPNKKSRTSGIEKSSSKVRKHQSIEYETSPPTNTSSDKDGGADSKDDCTCGAKKMEKNSSRKVPKIYFGTRTHKQITQIIRELKKTAYREVRMTILSSREHSCVHPVVSKMKNKNEGCKELLDGYGCRFNDRIKKIIPNQDCVKERGLVEAWDLEDLVEVCREHEACSYFGSRGLMKDADIVFCPYNYLIDAEIRDTLDINLKGQVLILDEAHNMEDCSREAASESITSEQLEKAISNLEDMIHHQIKVADHLRIRQMCSGILTLIEDNHDTLHQSDFDQAYKCWSGYEIVARLEHVGIGPKHKEELMRAYVKIRDTEEDPVVKDRMGNIVKLQAPVLITIDAIFKTLRYLFMEDLKFIHDYRVAILKSTTYVRDTDTNDKMLNSRRRRGGMQTKAVQVQSINFWCMNPGVAFSDLSACRNVVLSSGTLSPMSTFESELGVPFPIKLEASHVIEDKQVWVGAMGQGPQGGSLHCVYKNMETWTFQDEMGETVLKVCQKVPHGVLCFMPSYKALEKFRERWQRTGLWMKIEKKKRIICEPRASERIDFESVMREFYEQIEETEDDDLLGDVDGALFIAVCRGKVSEGLDFTDNNARAVITVGIPYPNFKDVQIKLKREYNDKYKMSRGLLSGGDWYEIQAFRALNQALGRCIRHSNIWGDALDTLLYQIKILTATKTDVWISIKDWGALILADERFVKNGAKYCKGLSKWVRNKVQQFGGFYTALDSLSTFTRDRIKDMPKINPDSTFIPGTPVTPGNFCIPSPISSTPVTQGVTPTSSSKKFNLSLTTPIKPVPDGLDTSSADDESSIMSTSPTMFVSPPTNKGVTKKSAYSLLSPTSVQNNKGLLQLSQNQQVVQMPQQVVLQKPAEPSTPFLGSTYNQILGVINSTHTPKDKPYYIILNEGTPQQQMYLIQPPANQQVGVANKTGYSIKHNMGVAKSNEQSIEVANKTGDSVKQNVGLAKSSEQSVGVASKTGDSVKQNVGVAKSSEQSAHAVGDVSNTVHSVVNNGNVDEIMDISEKTNKSANNNIATSSLSTNSSVIGSANTNTNVASILDSNQSATGTANVNNNTDKIGSGVNKLFKFCNIPAKTTEDKKTETSLIKEKSQVHTERKAAPTPRSQSPVLFDSNTDDSEAPRNSLINNVKQENMEVENEHDAERSGYQATKKKPIFKKGKQPLAVKREEEGQTESEKSDEDFKPRRSSVGSVLSKLGHNTVETDNSKEGGENKACDGPRRTGQRSRGIKRKSMNDAKGKKRPKGVDFLDDIVASKENKDHSPSVSCKKCGNILITNLKEFERRKRIPVFLNKIASRNTEVIFTESSASNSLTAVQSTEQGVSMNCLWDEALKCCVQYLQCVTCNKSKLSPVLGVKVIYTSSSDRTYQAGQTWLLSSAVIVDEKG